MKRLVLRRRGCVHLLHADIKSAPTIIRVTRWEGEKADRIIGSALSGGNPSGFYGWTLELQDMTTLEAK